VAHSREKYRFLRQQKDVWDHLIEEARLRREVAT
jgi:hypothetical protein